MQLAIAAIFLGGWLLFGYFILINLFVAVVNESFSVAEEQKRKQQLEAFVNRREPQAKAISWFRGKINPYNYTKGKPRTVTVENLVLPNKTYLLPDLHDMPRSEKVSCARGDRRRRHG